MKYTRLTKEQLEELHPEFINFLATQSITAEEWTHIKEKKPEVAEQEIDVFSDLVWEGVLNRASYLENISPQQFFLFKLGENEMTVIVIKSMDETIDITTPAGYQWLQQNYSGDQVEFFTATKSYTGERNTDVFTLINQGAIITKGEVYSFFQKILDA